MACITLACFVIGFWSSLFGSEALTLLCYAGSITIAAGLTGRFLSWSVGWGGLAISWGQIVPVYVLYGLSSELAEPTRSTGGMAGLALTVVALVVFSPLPLAASFVGARLRKLGEQKVDSAGRA